MNNWIEDSVKTHAKGIISGLKHNFEGIILPFGLGDDSDPYLIMSTVPELAHAFDTKKRAPFKVVFETVKLKEVTMREEN